MKNKLIKMLAYTELVEQSEKKEDNILSSPFYIHFGNLEEKEREIKFQKKVTRRLANRLQTLKLEL